MQWKSSRLQWICIKRGEIRWGGCLPDASAVSNTFCHVQFFPGVNWTQSGTLPWAADLINLLTPILTLPLRSDVRNHVSLWTLLMRHHHYTTMKMTGSSPGQDQPGMKVIDVHDAGNVHADFLITFHQDWLITIFLQTWSPGSRTWFQKIYWCWQSSGYSWGEQEETSEKSKWQQRLEEAARRRGINPPKR